MKRTRNCSKKHHLGLGIYADVPDDHEAVKHTPKVFLASDTRRVYTWHIYNGERSANLKAKFFKKGAGSKADSVNAIFDSGAQSVCLKESICEKLGLVSVGEANVSGATGSDKSKIYKCSVKLECALIDNNPDEMRQDLYFKDVFVWGITLPGHTDALIGWPIIKSGEFSIDHGLEVSLAY